MTQQSTDSKDVVRAFWTEVWNEGRLDRIADFMTEDFVIHSGGRDIGPRQAFADWVRDFHGAIDDLVFDIRALHSDGPAVTTLWRITGRNAGFMGTPANGKPVRFTGLTLSIVTPDGRIAEKWVERSAWELYPTLT
ncbi:MAG: ester cyclase [Pseudomonadota bacterium]